MANLIRATALNDFAEVVKPLGGDADALMRGRGINPKQVGDFERFLPYDAVAAVVSDAAETLGCPDFGLRLARAQGIEKLGPVAVILRNAATAAEAVDKVTHYLHNVAPTDHSELIHGDTVSKFSFTTTVRQLAHRDQMVELGLGVAMDAFRLMLGEDFVPVRVTMQHARQGPQESYREMFGCDVDFDAELNSIVIPNALLSREIHDRDVVAYALAENYLATVDPEPAAPDHVRELTRRLLLVNQASLVFVARAMSLHPRVLQRRLAESRTSFEEILDDVRRETAWNLAATGMQISQIARMLGYAEHSSFSRACRRWFNESPKQLLARRRSARPED